MNSKNRWMRVDLVLAFGVLVLAFALSTSAQVQTSTNTTAQPATTEVTVENAEVVYVQGDDVILKMSDGSIRDISHVPENARITVDGKEIGIKDVKVGMKLQRTITTTTTPKVVTTVQTVQGKVFRVQPPNSVILTLDNGTNQQFDIPEGQKFMVDGEETDAFGLKKGMMISATKVVEEPVTEVERESKVSGVMPTPPPPPADRPILVAVVVPKQPAPPAQEARNEPPTKELPKSGSELPLLALLGSLSLMGAAGLRLFRRIRG